MQYKHHWRSSHSFEAADFFFARRGSTLTGQIPISVSSIIHRALHLEISRTVFSQFVQSFNFTFSGVRWGRGLTRGWKSGVRFWRVDGGLGLVSWGCQLLYWVRLRLVSGHFWLQNGGVIVKTELLVDFLSSQTKSYYLNDQPVQNNLDLIMVDQVFLGQLTTWTQVRNSSAYGV